MKSSEPAGLTEVPISKKVVLQLLSHIPSDLILVGGQALAFWVEHSQLMQLRLLTRMKPMLAGTQISLASATM